MNKIKKNFRLSFMDPRFHGDDGLVKKKISVIFTAFLLVFIVSGFLLKNNKKPTSVIRKPLTFTRQFVGDYQYRGEVKGVMTASFSKDKDEGRVDVKRADSKLSFSIPLTDSSLDSDSYFNPEAVSFTSKDKIIEAKYSLVPNGLKEEIILNKIPQENKLPISLKTENLKMKITPDGIPVFYAPSSGTSEVEEQSGKTSEVNKIGKYMFHFERPFMKDGAGNVSYGVKYLFGGEKKAYGKTVKKLLSTSTSEVEEQNGKTSEVVMVVEIDSSWLHDPKRVLPITIDPTVVHDTTSEFATGSFNRTKDTGSGSSPVLETYYQELPADQYTVGLWHMNEASGNVLDSSGNGNTGTPTGTTVVTGLLGNARSFNGTSDYIKKTSMSSQPTGNSPITLSAWFYSNSLSGARVISSVGVDGGSPTAYGIYTNGSNAVASFASSNGIATGTITLQTGQWYFIVGVYDGSTNKVYVNGVLDKSVSYSSANLSAGDWNVGSWVNQASLFSGSIDEISLSNTARTPEQIKASASRRPYSVYTSDVIDLATVTSWNSLSWTELGVNTGDGETLKDATSLVAQWNFNATTSTATATNDAGSCGASCNGTLTSFANTTGQDVLAGSGWTAANRRWGAGALMFDGSNDYVSVPSVASLAFGTGQFTIEAWVNAKSLTTNNVIFYSQSSNVAGFYGLGYNNSSGFFLTFYNGSTRPTTYNNRFPIVLGQWYHVVGLRDASNNLIVYVNSIASTINANSNLSLTAADPRFGINPASGSEIWSGTIDSSRIYSRALGAAEILSNYQAGNIEFQTRVGADTSPDDGSWEAWKPTTEETVIDSMDTSAETWTIDNNPDSSSTINKISAINTGTGNDGDCIINNGTKTLDTTAGSSVCNGSARSTAYAVNFSVTGNTPAYSTSITVSSTPTGIVAGDEILIINLQGTGSNYNNVGRYETHIVSSVSTNTLNFTDYPLKYTYDGTTQKIMVQRVPNFGAVTVCGGNTGGGCSAAATVIATAWNGTKNGILFFRSNGAVTVNSGGTISVAGKGYRGGSWSDVQGYQGESYGGTGSQTTNANFGAGGGGYFNGGSNGVGLGGQASHGTIGNVAGCEPNCTARGAQGNLYNENSDKRLFMGSGGGGAALYTTPGGYGGGIIDLFSNSLTINGTINANGLHDTTWPEYAGDGSGGSVIINSSSITLGSSLLTSNGGNGAGKGRITIYYISSLSGTTTPAAYTQKLQSQSFIKSEGTGAMQIQTGRPEMDSSTVGLWHLDETSGNANNSTALTGLTLTAINSPGSTNGFFGKARNFIVGNSQYFTCTDTNCGGTTKLDPNSTTGWTFSSWVYANSYPTQSVIYSKSGATNNSGPMFFMNSSGQLRSEFGNSSCNNDSGIGFTSAAVVPLNKWTHVTTTVSAANPGVVKIYVDGSLKYTSGAVGYYCNSADDFYFGAHRATLFWDGKMDEAIVSQKVATDEEIAEAYRAGRDHYLNRTISATDLSAKTSLPFYVAADRPGSYLSATIGESAFANYQPDGNTVGLWHLAEQSGSGAYIKDSSGNSNHGTPTGTTFTQGKIGKGRSFNGSSDRISLGTTGIPSGNSNYSIEAWIKPTAGGTYGIAGWGQWGTVNGVNAFRLCGTSCLVNYWWGNDLTLTTPNLVDGNWHYVVAQFDGTTRSIWVDGFKIGQDTPTGHNTVVTDVNIGRTNNTEYFPGIIDEVRISNTARTADQIRQAYEVGLRTHPITIDFGAKLDSGNLITGSGDLGFTVDATYYGLQNKGDQLFKGDKIIVKENYDGTEYIAQGTVTAVTASTGAATVSAWDSGSTFPSGGYTVNASVFKWQREYWNPSASLGTHRDAITNLTLRLTDGSEGRTVWLDDLRSNSNYLTTPGGSTITSSLGNRYFQYRAILSSNDEVVSSSLSSVTLNYEANSPPNTPTLDLPTDVATNQLLSPVLKTTTTDGQSDYLRYKIELCTDLAMTLNCQTFDQTSSQTGWSGQNTETSTAYTSGTQATYTIQTPLVVATTYYWRSYAIDPGGTNTWSGTQTPYSFTTTTAPTAPTTPYAEGATNPVSVTDLTPEFSAIHNDPDADAANYYEIEVNTNSGFTGTVMWDTGQTSMASVNNGARSADVSYAGTTLTFNGTTYYWRIRFWDTKGAVGAWSTTQNFTMNTPPTTPTLDLPINGAIDMIFFPILKTTTTDTNSDYLRYKIQLCTNALMTIDCQTFDQTSSQTGWSGQNTQSNTAYTSGTQGIYTVQSALITNTNYYWRSYAKDPGGSNTWSSTQTTPYMFTTTLIVAPSPPTSLLTNGSSNPTGVLLSTLPYFSAIHNDSDNESANYYQIKVSNQPDVNGSILWDSGMTSMSTTLNGSRSPNITYAGSALPLNGQIFYWMIRFRDVSNNVGAWSTPASFTLFSLISPASCMAIKNNQNTQITINWLDRTSSEDGYYIEKKTDGGGFTNLVTKAANSVTHVDAAVSSGHSYQYRVRSKTGSDYSDWCTTALLNLGIGFQIY